MAFRCFYIHLKVLAIVIIAVLGYCFDSSAVSINTAQLQSVDWSNRSTSYSFATIHSLIFAGPGKTYYQTGLGWLVLSAQGELQVLAPAHVVKDAGVITAHVANVQVSLQILALSEARDLAILKFVSAQDLKNLKRSVKNLIPLMDFSNSSANYSRFLTKSWLKTPKSFHWGFVRNTINYRVNSSDTNAFNQLIEFSPDVVTDVLPANALASEKGVGTYGGNDLLVLENIGIRPGLSGAPVLVQDRKGSDRAGLDIKKNGAPFLVGMITRTEMVGMTSLAITLDDIVKVYAKLASQGSLFVDDESSSWIEYQTQWVGNNLVRNVLMSPTRATQNSLGVMEACVGDYQESSDWSLASFMQDDHQWDFIDADSSGGREVNSILSEILAEGEKQRKKVPAGANIFKDAKDSSLSMGGGDYGESGGGLLRLGQFFAGQIDTRDDHEYYQGQIFFHKNQSRCKTAGLKTPAGKILTGYIDSQGQGHKVSTLDDMQWELKGLSAADRIKKSQNILDSGVYLEPGSFDLRLLCLSQALQGNKRAGFQGVTEINWNTEYVKNMAALVKSNTRNFIGCNEQGSEFTFNLQRKDLNPKTVIPKHEGPTTQGWESPDLNIQLRVNSSGQIGGKVRIGERCSFVLNPKNTKAANIWKYQIRDRHLHANVSFDSKGHVAAVQVLDYAPVCIYQEFNGLNSNSMLLDEIHVLEKFR